MNNFNISTGSESSYNFSPTSISQNENSNADVIFRDLRTITRTLRDAGLLHKGSALSKIRIVIKTIIHDTQQKPPTIKKTIRSKTNTRIHGRKILRATQNAVNRERMARSHQLIAQSLETAGARTFLSSGMKRALSKLSSPEQFSPGLSDPQRRALLPSISIQTFQSNRRLAEAIASDESIPDLEIIVANTMTDNGKQGYSDVKDFVSALRKKAPAIADAFTDNVINQLEGIALRRFRKLLMDQPPVESDFIDPPCP